jgi:hypothetical protein
MALDHDEAVVALDYEAWQAVGLGVDQAERIGFVGIVERCTACEGGFQALAEELGIDRLRKIAAEDAYRDLALRIVIAECQGAALVVYHSDDIPRLRSALELFDGARENPGVAAA